jgi:hypothetical protein
VTFCNELIFYGEELLAPISTPKLEGPPLVCCPQLLVQYIHSYPPYLEAVSSICNLRRTHIKMNYELPRNTVIKGSAPSLQKPILEPYHQPV